MWELLRGTPKGQKTCPKSLQLTFTKVAITTAMKLRLLLLGRKATTDKSRQHAEKQRYHLANKGPYSQNYSFSSSHVHM